MKYHRCGTQQFTSQSSSDSTIETILVYGCAYYNEELDKDNFENSELDDDGDDGDDDDDELDEPIDSTSQTTRLFNDHWLNINSYLRIVYQPATPSNSNPFPFQLTMTAFDIKKDDKNFHWPEIQGLEPGFLERYEIDAAKYEQMRSSVSLLLLVRKPLTYHQYQKSHYIQSSNILYDDVSPTKKVFDLPR